MNNYQYPKDLVNRIINNDCMDVTKYIPDRSVDMVLCDLPYGLTANKWDFIIPLDWLWKEYARLIKPNGVVVLTSQGRFSAQLIMSSEGHVDYKYSMVWIKPNHTNFVNAKKQPLRKHEDLLVFYNDQPVYNPQGLEKFNKMTRQGAKMSDSYGGNKNGKPRASQYFQEYTNYPTDVIYTQKATTKKHPTEKPVELFSYLMKTYTNEGGLVIDNCVGSGTTAVVAKCLKRNFICIEKNKEYYDMAIKRLRDSDKEEEKIKMPLRNNKEDKTQSKKGEGNKVASIFDDF